MARVPVVSPIPGRIHHLDQHGGNPYSGQRSRSQLAYPHQVNGGAHHSDSCAYGHRPSEGPEVANNTPLRPVPFAPAPPTPSVAPPTTFRKIPNVFQYG